MPDFIITIYAGLVGLTAAGFIGSSWALVAGRPPTVSLLRKRTIAFPAAFLALLLHAPIMLCGWALRLGRRHPWRSAGLMSLALLWSFIQGVFILTHIFGVR